MKIRSDMTNRTLPPKLCVNAAIERLEAAVRLDPSKDYSYYQLSVAYRRGGRLEDAQHVLEAYQKLKEKERGTEHP